MQPRLIFLAVRPSRSLNLKSEVGERFIAQKACDGKPYLRSGTAKNAVPAVGMTNFGWWMR